MSNSNSPRPRQYIELFALCAIAFSSTMFVTSYFMDSRQKPAVRIPKSTQRNREGFDFSIILKLKSGIGPEVGEKIDLTQLKGRDGVSLAKAIGESPAIIVAVDDQCGMCQIAANEIRYIYDRLADSGIRYYIVSFTSHEPSSFFGFIDSLGIDISAFMWAKEISPPPEPLFTMVVPSHLMIDRTGIVIRKWPGASEDKSIRERMANQIINDTFNALLTK